LKNYTGWLSKTIFKSPEAERLLAELECYQARFLAEKADHYQNGWVHVRGRPLYTGDHLFGWSRQYEYPYIVANIPSDVSLEILDVGSGFSFLPFYLKGLNHTICTADIEPLQTLYQNSGITFFQDDITQTQISNSFDLIYSVSVLEHIANKKAAFENIYRLLKPKGWLILTMDCDLGRTTTDTTPPIEELFENIGLLNNLFNTPWQNGRYLRNELITTLDFSQQEGWRLPWRKMPVRYKSGWQWLRRTLKNPKIVHEEMPILGVFVGVWEKGES